MNARFTELELRWLKISLGRQWRLATRPFIVPSQRTIVTKLIGRQSTQADENSFMINLNAWQWFLKGTE